MFILFAVIGVVLGCVSIRLNEKVAQPTRLQEIGLISLLLLGIVSTHWLLSPELFVPGLTLGWSITIWATTVCSVIACLTLMLSATFDWPKAESWAGSVGVFAWLLAMAISVVSAIVHIWVPFR